MKYGFMRDVNFDRSLNYKQLLLEPIVAVEVSSLNSPILS